jgi:hypothetical protein
MSLPEFFCWTRFGTEAGQSIHQILARKEQERAANGGVFFWGIGNAIGPSMTELLRRTDCPEAIFSPIRSAPKRKDTDPSSVVAWSHAETLAGERYYLPMRSLITSRYDRMNPRARHHALVCFNESPLIVRSGTDRVPFTRVRNVLTNRRVGASQVTAVVSLRHVTNSDHCVSYDVAFRVRLVPPFFIVLRAPVPLVSSDERQCWADVVARTWDGTSGTTV